MRTHCVLEILYISMSKHRFNLRSGISDARFFIYRWVLVWLAVVTGWLVGLACIEYFTLRTMRGKEYLNWLCYKYGKTSFIQIPDQWWWKCRKYCADLCRNSLDWVLGRIPSEKDCRYRGVPHPGRLHVPWNVVWRVCTHLPCMFIVFEANQSDNDTAVLPAGPAGIKVTIKQMESEEGWRVSHSRPRFCR